MASGLIGSVSSVMSSQLNSLKAAPRKLVSSFKKVGSKFKKQLNKLFKTLLKKPSAKEDYVKFGLIYLSKRAVIILTVVFIALIYLFVKFFYPWADGNLWTASIKLNSQKYYSFTGKKAKVKDAMGVVIYRGEMSDGSITGYGTQYDSYGNMVYEGEFLEGNYSGQGKLYRNGVLIYKGSFAQSLYQGEGELYNDSGDLIYKGNFEAGLKSGTGIEYSAATGKRIYSGSFANDVREGNGTEFLEDGNNKLYEGAFASGKYEGAGKLYENGVLKYIGNFANGIFEGEGTMYDIVTSKMIYKGSFASGLYEGEGVLYDPETSKMVYQGAFVAGQKSGEGSIFDSLGAVSFNGEFKDDNINYLNYLGAALDEITKQFGKESYRQNTNDNKLVLTYLSLDMSLIFKTDADSGAYVCEKMILGNKQTFSGLNSTSPRSEIIKVMGNPYSSIDYTFAKYYDTVFKQLSINLSSGAKAPSDKFLMDGYFVRFYYNNNRTEYLSIEISKL